MESALCRVSLNADKLGENQGFFWLQVVEEELDRVLC